VTSETVAPSALTSSAPSTFAATPCAPAPIETVRVGTRESATTGHSTSEPNGVIVPRT